jgi:hypothetical protein
MPPRGAPNNNDNNENNNNTNALIQQLVAAQAQLIQMVT